MRYLFLAVLAAAIGWGAYWVIGARSLESGLDSWFDQRRAENWQAEYTDLTVQGFPNRFDAGFSGLAVADPHTGLAWEAPFFQISMLSYKPHHVIAVWPDRHRLATPLDRFDLANADMRASLVVKPGVSLQLDRVNLTADRLTIVPAGGKQGTRIDKLALAAALTGAQDLPTYHLGLSASDVTLADSWLAQLDPDGAMPATLAGVRADLTVGFDRHWDRSALDTARPQPRRIDLRLAEARWGDLLLQATGKLDVDADGIPTGDITVKAENWREILTMARASGQLPEPVADLLERGLETLAALSGRSRNLDVPLTFARGQIRIGPLPVAPAPVIRIR